MNKEIKSVLAMKPKPKKTKKIAKVLTLTTAVLLGGFVLLASCGNIANQAEVKPVEIIKVQAPRTTSYTVKQGDTLSGIAAKHSDRWSADTPLALIVEAIKEKNSKVLINGYLLQAGSTIEIPIWK